MEESSSPKASCWSTIVKKDAPPPQQQQPLLLNTQHILEDTRNRHGISVAIVDANAVIQSGETLHSLADKFVSVPEVIEEIRDPVSRHRLSFLPFTIQTMEPSPESINKVVKFARVTGDLQTLSDVDIKLIALAYTLEAQIHGTKHLKDSPPPVQTVNVKRLPEKDLPGWGLNVPNLQEWEALERENEDNVNSNSRILPLQDLSLNIVPQDDLSVDGSVDHTAETPLEIHDGGERGSMRRKNYLPKKKVVNLEGKTVAEGINASQGEVEDNGGDWMPAVSRSTHRRFLRRKARREQYEALSSNQDPQDMEENIDGSVSEDAKASNQVHENNDEKHIENVVSKNDMISAENYGDEALSATLKQMTLEEGSLEALNEENALSLSPEELQSKNAGLLESVSDGSAIMDIKSCETDPVNDKSNYSEIASQTSEAADFSNADDDVSEQSWMVRSLSESTVACITGDFAMQNVLLQMGLRLLAPGGSQIHQLHRWILKCHACFAVTAEIGRIFCPKCGNGGTLRKVAVTVNENGIMLAARRPRITLRGTKFSLPLPQGGRDAVTKNVILREDQLPQRVLYPKTKKKANKDDDFFTPDNVFSHHNDKGAPFQAPVRKALATFSGRRNPNDNHYSRSKRK
ncbi:RNA-binding NOB1-like protein [Cicer arietinum]|uniref:RNA-binding protein NOB1 n=1 Tax=Cicer arietinum TaxID=3827 RepID=A0A1S3E9Z2_CICAR|nr:RNA-binding protein NOB1 [Cicer arietinum]